MYLLPLLLVVACGGGRGADPDGAPATEVSATIDWVARTVTVTGSDLGVAFCEGEAPLLCVGGVDGGVIELATFPDSSVDDFDAWADDFYASIGADRIEGCDPAYELVGDDVSTVGGWTRYGFSGSVGGVEQERVVGYARNDGTSLVLLVANALADDACLSRESELPLALMDDVEPVLEALAVATP